MNSKMITLVFIGMFTVFVHASTDNEQGQTLRRTSRDSSDLNDLVPLINIRGTKLYTGIYYKVGMKVFGKGWITWTNRRNYIEVELDPSQLPNYELGKPNEYDNQWSFGATESDLGYTLTNRGKHMGFLIWVNSGAGSGYHVSVYDDPESIRKMSAGGEWRNDALWIPQSTTEENFYKLENLAYRGSFLTWTYKKHNEFNYYIQMGSYDAKEDSKFSFQPSGIKLEAKIYDFEFGVSPDDILKQDQNINRSLLAKKHFPNFSDAEITSTIEESQRTNDSITISFKESLTMMYKIILETGGDEHVFEGGLNANEQKSLEVPTSLSLKTEIKIAAYTDIEARIYAVKANKAEIPFTAKMSVVGVAERMVVNRPGETKLGSVPADVAEDFYKSSGGRKMEVISRSGDNWIVRVSGLIKGNVSLKLVMNTAEATIFTKPPTTTHSSMIWD